MNTIVSSTKCRSRVIYTVALAVIARMTLLHLAGPCDYVIEWFVFAGSMQWWPGDWRPASCSHWSEPSPQRPPTTDQVMRWSLQRGNIHNHLVTIESNIGTCTNCSFLRRNAWTV